MELEVKTHADCSYGHEAVWLTKGERNVTLSSVLAATVDFSSLTTEQLFYE